MPDEERLRSKSDEGRDLYDVATWERRTVVDKLAYVIYWLVAQVTRAAIVLVAFAILVAIGGLSALTDPQIGTLTALSAIPALGLAVYVKVTDSTSGEPLVALVATFLLGVLTANFAAVVNSIFQPYFGVLGGIGTVLFFFLVVGPVEETVKLLAVRFHAYNLPSFDSVVDGAVYGAVAGLGFATVENALYIARQVGEVDGGASFTALIGVGGGITAVRALAGPGHVIYSAIAGYYLGLAKFNPDDRGPIIVKGLLIATVVHATYNSTVGIGSEAIASIPGVASPFGFIGYVLIYDTIWGLYLLRKLRRYSATYSEVRESRTSSTSGTPGEAD